MILRGNELHCQLDAEGSYDLVEAYKANPHILFANADSDEKLVDFIRAWGPLREYGGETLADGSVHMPLDVCRAYQRQIKALIGALTAFKWGKGEREALEELVLAAREEWEWTVNILAGTLPIKRDFPKWAESVSHRGDVLKWTKSASLQEVRFVTSALVENIVGSGYSLKLTLQRKRHRRQVVAGWKFMSLEQALRWMIWYDELNEHPIICCAECRKVFRGETARPRKYCSEKCGHKATARKAMQNKRTAERTERN